MAFSAAPITMNTGTRWNQTEVQADAVHGFRIHRGNPSDPPDRAVWDDGWIDRAAAMMATLLAGLVYFHYMAPSVTLQDSGELITGAFTFGVPHPPGYPLWTLLGWLWSNRLLPVGNPAWRIGMLSVGFGALTVGIMTIMMIRSLRLLLRTLPWADIADDGLHRWIAVTLGLSTAFLFGFNQGVWLWAGVSEMRALNVFSFILMSYCLFLWVLDVTRRRYLYATIAVFASGLANHQTIALMVIPIALVVAGIEIQQFIDRRRNDPATDAIQQFVMGLRITWELVTAGLLALGGGLVVWSWLTYPPAPDMWRHQPFWLGSAITAGGVAGLDLGRKTGCWRPGRALAYAGIFALGISVYLYMPLAAATNPPMNWGYTATREGFARAITRQQYEQIEVAKVMSRDFVLQIRMSAQWLMDQYGAVPSALALVMPLVLVVAWKRFRPRARIWAGFVVAAFLTTGFGLLVIVNPAINLQHQAVAMKYFAPSHGYFAMLIGYGFAVVLSLAGCWRRGRFRRPLQMACVALLALPVIPLYRNWAVCNQRDHDYGYLFGYLMFNPGNGYEPMEPGSILFGGSDPGRFVPTYMIFCESRVDPKHRFRDAAFDRSDVYMLTQNALADKTYLETIQDHYGINRPDIRRPQSYAHYPFWRRTAFRLGSRSLRRNRLYPEQPIHLPDSDVLDQAYMDYFEDVQAAGGGGTDSFILEDGRIEVRGQESVMSINAALARWIVERNREEHAVYVEESLPIPWMNAYLRPFGVIMKLETDPLPSPDDDPELWSGIVSRDMAYWRDLSDTLLGRPSFHRNEDAKLAFSKLRSAQAGVYAARGLDADAEKAFRQALRLHPQSPGTLYRLAFLYLEQNRFDEARALMNRWRALDPHHAGTAEMLETIRVRERAYRRMQALEGLMGVLRFDINRALELAGLYHRFGLETALQRLISDVLANPRRTPRDSLALAGFLGDVNRFALQSEVLTHFLNEQPDSYAGWLALGYARLRNDRAEAGLDALRQALRTGGTTARSVLLYDERFRPFRTSAGFAELLGLQPTNR